jgi:CheY-like chemotaxis protein
VTSALRILLLEDNDRDAELIQELLESDHFVCEVTRVQTRAEFIAGLENSGINLILADYKLPSFDGLSALKLALDARPDLPFIFVSGTLGEEVAIEAVKFGATDYVVKSRLSRLVPSVQRALREARARAERKNAEEALRRNEMYLAEAQRLSHTGSFGWDPASGEIYWSNETYRIFECEPTIEPTVQIVLDRTHPDDRMRLRQIIDRASIERSEFTAEHRLLMADGSVKYVRAVAHPSTGEDPESFLFVGAVMDITERKRAEEERERLRQLEADFAYMNRVSIMGELAASLAHEIKQPMAAAAITARPARTGSVVTSPT